MNKRFVLYGIIFVVCSLIFCVTLAACGMCLVLCFFFGLISFGLLLEFAYYAGR